jgi:ABC-type uncharacterized transport system fused permease/ATPase subunit
MDGHPCGRLSRFLHTQCDLLYAKFETVLPADSPYWLHPREWFSWLLLLTLTALTLGVVWISVQYNNWSQVFYDALSNYFQHVSIGMLALTYAGYTALFVTFIISSNWLKNYCSSAGDRR